MQPDRRPLPESLTRLLAASPPAARDRPSAAERTPPADQASAHAALESALLRGFVYGVSGLVWLVVMLMVIRHVAG